MKLFNKFIDFETLGLFYQFFGTIAAFLHISSFEYSGASVGKFHYLLSLPKELTAPYLYFTLSLIFIGFCSTLINKIISNLKKIRIINFILLKSLLFSLSAMLLPLFLAILLKFYGYYDLLKPAIPYYFLCILSFLFLVIFFIFFIINKKSIIAFIKITRN